MGRWINELLERLNASLAKRPGLLPLAGLLLIVLNFALQFVLGPEAWLAATNLLLHLGLIVSIVGILLLNVYRH